MAKSPRMSKRETYFRFLPKPLPGREYVNVAEAAVLLDVPESRVNNWNAKINKESPGDLPDYLKSFPKRYLGPRVSFLYDKEDILEYRKKYEKDYTNARAIGRVKQEDRMAGWIRIGTAMLMTSLPLDELRRYFEKNYRFRVMKEPCEEHYKHFPHVIMHGNVMKVNKEEFLKWEQNRKATYKQDGDTKQLTEVEAVWRNFIYGNRGPRKDIGYF